jgi:hypothetical protein
MDLFLSSFLQVVPLPLALRPINEVHYYEVQVPLIGVFSQKFESSFFRIHLGLVLHTLYALSNTGTNLYHHHVIHLEKTSAYLLFIFRCCWQPCKMMCVASIN